MSILRSLALVAVLPLPIIGMACGTSSSTPYGTGTGSGSGGGSGSSSGGGSGSSSGGGSGSSSGGGSGSSSGSGSGGFTEAAHAPFPTLKNQGIPVITAPKIVAVTFNNDPNAAGIGSFFTALGSSPYWSTIMKDYGVGPTTGQSVAVTATLAASYTDLPPGGGTGTWPAFVANTIATAAGMPAPDGNTIYAFFVPSTTTLTVQGAQTCVNVGGYHNSTPGAGGKTIYYATVNECNGAKLGNRTFNNELDFDTFAISHEIAEAATDPSITSTASTFSSGFYNDLNDDPKDDYAWTTLGDGEVADFCVDQFGFTSPNDTATVGTNLVQRSWSISAAAAGTNPCLPVPSGEIYFNAAPAEGSDLLIVPAAGGSATIEVDAFSDAAKSWTLLAVDLGALQTGTAGLTMSFAGGATEAEPGLTIGSQPSLAVSNGTKAQLSVKLTATLSATSAQTAFAPAVLISHDGTSLLGAQNDHYWPFVVTTQAIATQLGVGLTTGPIHLGKEMRAQVFSKLRERQLEH